MAIYRPGNRGTIRSNAEYSVQEACVKLYEAMKGFGTDEAKVIDVLASHTAQERQDIKSKYKIQYGKDLVKELDSELSFDFCKLVLALMEEPEDYLLGCVHKAISSSSGQKRGGKLFKRLSAIFKEGLGGKEYLLIALLCTRSNAELRAIKKAYKKSYGDKLEDKIANDGNNMPNDVCSFILDMISGEREEAEDEEVDLEHLAEDIDELSIATNEDALHALLQERSFVHLRRLFDEVQNVCGKTIGGILDDLEGVVSPELLQAYKAMVSLIKDGEPDYYAERVKGAIEGAGTDDDTLIKVVVLRAEVDLLDILESYEKKYNAEMAAEVGDDTSGDYKELLLRLLTKPQSSSPSHQLADINEVVVSEQQIKEKEETSTREEIAAQQQEEHVENRGQEEIEETILETSETETNMEVGKRVDQMEKEVQDAEEQDSKIELKMGDLREETKGDEVTLATPEEERVQGDEDEEMPVADVVEKKRVEDEQDTNDGNDGNDENVEEKNGEPDGNNKVLNFGEDAEDEENGEADENNKLQISGEDAEENGEADENKLQISGEDAEENGEADENKLQISGEDAEEEENGEADENNKVHSFSDDAGEEGKVVVQDEGSGEVQSEVTNATPVATTTTIEVDSGKGKEEEVDESGSVPKEI